jgi:2-dehydropantoate 2-reductase
VIGAGAVGCYFGGILARAGHQVTLIGRPHHVSAIQQQGLLLTTQTFEEHIKLHASTELAAIHDADVILFCVKSTDTIATATQAKPHLSDQCSDLEFAKWCRKCGAHYVQCCHIK